MKRSLKWLLPLVVISLAAIAIVPIVLVARPRWPALSEQDKIQILAALSEWQRNGQTGKIPEAEWPISITSLNPRYVFIQDDQLTILISSGGINPGWGYLVTSNGAPKLQGYLEVNSDDPRFQKYTQQD